MSWSKSHIVLSSIGTTGDVLPFASIGRQLIDRGFQVTVMANENHESFVRQQGLTFFPSGEKDWPQVGRNEAAFFEHAIIPGCYAVYEAMTRLVESGPVGLMVNRSGHWGAAFSAEKLNIPVVRLALQPCAIRKGGHPISPGGLRQLNEFRRRIGLSETAAEDGLAEPALQTISLFEHNFGLPQSEWEEAGIVAGFPPVRGGSSLPSDLTDFLRRHNPVVFSIGSGAGIVPEMESVALQLSHEYPVLLLGSNVETTKSRGALFLQHFADHSIVFRNAAAVVHNGGIGTCVAALRAGIPQIIVPLGYDQPDNADRLCNLGVAQAIPVESFDIAAMRIALQLFRSNMTLASTLAQAAETMQKVDGVKMAADEIANIVYKTT